MSEPRYYPATYADERPFAPAVVLARTGDAISWRRLDERSTRIARLLRDVGLRTGDTVALLIENHPTAYEIVWAVLRSGLRYTFVNSMLTSGEAVEIVDSASAPVMICSTRLLALGDAIAAALPALEHRFAVRSTGDLSLEPLLPGWRALDDAIATMSPTRLPDEREGAPLWFSSGTSGRPKGVLRALPDAPAGTLDDVARSYGERYGFSPSTVHLTVGPLHHAAPIGFSTMVQRFGGTVVLTERFDAEEMLRYIEHYRVTFTHVVPTMFVRLLKLPGAVRDRYDVTSLQHVLHGAAPCPVEVKRQMIAWWGPILDEYYAGTEGVGATTITSDEWLEHPGSVGRAQRGTIHIADDSGCELPAGTEGTVWFDHPVKAVYRGDPAQTAAITHARGWQTLGDVGFVDHDGYLFLTDRWTHKIVTGGVNVFPREIEDVLVAHPKVLDVAVIGTPHEEMGEEVRAVVEPVDWDDAGAPLAAELVAWCRDRLAHHKCPRAVDFAPTLPRGDNGKLYKRLIRDRYWTDRPTRIL
ncbi:MAG TPA: AMP-binding protein [Acidimicrobiia bacterium]